MHTIIECLRISRRTFYYILELWITTGDVICTLTIDGMISNTVVEGSMTRDQFLHYLEFTVVCAGGCHGRHLGLIDGAIQVGCTISSKFYQGLYYQMCHRTDSEKQE